MQKAILLWSGIQSLNWSTKNKYTVPKNRTHADLGFMIWNGIMFIFWAIKFM